MSDGVDARISLARLLREQGTPGLPLPTVLSHLGEAAEALTFLHIHDPPIVHGDVRPANLIVTGGGRVSLVDSGLPSTTDSGSRWSDSAGFQAPELLSGGPPSRASDVYALAACACALLTGAAPTDGPPVLEGLQDAGVAAAIRSGLAANPAERPGTPVELVQRMRSGWAATLPSGAMTFCMSDIEG